MNLMLEQALGGSAHTTASKIDKLNELGVSAKDIAKILGIKLNHVTGALAKIKRRAG